MLSIKKFKGKKIRSSENVIEEYKKLQREVYLRPVKSGNRVLVKL
jgi:hypothetical protein